MASRSKVTVSGIDVDADEPRDVLGLQVRSGELADSEGEDGSPIACFVGPDEDAPEVYVIQRRAVDDQFKRDALVMLGFSGPALARAIFAATHKAVQYRWLNTIKADAYRDLLEGESEESDDDKPDDDEADG